MPFISINNIDIHYQLTNTKGKNDKEVIIFIHGLGSSLKDWEEQIAFFGKNYQILTCDLRGHGKSDKPNIPYNIPLFTKDISTLIKKLKISKAHIVGISLGGMVAFQLAIDTPHIVKSLTIVNSIPEFTLRNYQEKVAFFGRILILKIFGMRIIAKMLGKKLFPKAVQQTIRQKFIKRWQANDKKAYYNSLIGSLGWNVTQQLSKITAPTLFIASENDYTSLAVKQQYITKISNAKLVIIKNSRHALPVEKPKEFNQTLLSFFNFVVKSR